MTDGPIVSARLTAAKAEARRATDQVRHTSAARLAELLRLPAAERLAHLDDAVLVAADRTILRRSLQVSLPRTRRRARFLIPLRGPRARRLVAGVVRLGLTLEIVVPLLIAAAWLGLAWSRTAHIATLTRDVPIRLVADDGRVVDAILRSGHAHIMGRDWNGMPQWRHWLPGRGYETVTLPPNAIVWGRSSRRQGGS